MKKFVHNNESKLNSSLSRYENKILILHLYYILYDNYINM